MTAFAGFVLIAGAVAVAIRLGSFELPPFWAATLRYAVAGAIFTALTIGLRIPFPSGASLLGTLLFSLSFVVSTALLYAGVSNSSASIGAIAFALTPLVTLALAASIGLERFTRRGVAGALVAATGTVVVVGDQLEAAVPIPALLALAGAMLFGSITSVVIKRLPPGQPIAANAVGGVFVLPILLALSLITHESWALPSRPETWAALLFLVLPGTVLLFPLAIFIIGRWTASGYSYSGLFKPLTATALAAVLLGEPIRPTFVLGGALILGGVWLGALSSQSPSSAASAAIGPEPRLSRVPAATEDRLVG